MSTRFLHQCSYHTDVRGFITDCFWRNFSCLLRCSAVPSTEIGQHIISRRKSRLPLYEGHPTISTPQVPLYFLLNLRLFAFKRFTSGPRLRQSPENKMLVLSRTRHEAADRLTNMTHPYGGFLLKRLQIILRPDFWTTIW